MTILELIEKKQALEKEIADKLMKFESETKLKVTDINLYGIACCDYSCYEEKKIGVNIEVKL